VKWVALPLHPEIPQQGQTLAELFAGQAFDLPRMLDRMQHVARELDLPVRERQRVSNSRRATELGKWAEGLGRGDEFHRAVFHAYFAEGVDIGNLDVLQNICSRLDLDPDEAGRVLAEGRCRDQVDEDWAYALRLGVNAVPTFLSGGRRVVGAQPYEVLRSLVAESKL